MADHADDGDSDGDIFIYRGGRAPQHVTHVRIDESVDEIEEAAFKDCEHLVKVETHDGLRKVGSVAFWGCVSLRRINLKSAVEIDECAFYGCKNLESVEFGDRLETIGNDAFRECSLTHLKLPTIITIAAYAFSNCSRLIDIELSERLETIERSVFGHCERLQRIAIPLKRHLFEVHQRTLRYTQFDDCEQLVTVDLVGGIHKTVASLHMDSWRTEMIAEINRINQVLPTIPADDKTGVIRQWMELVVDKIDNCKAEHNRYVKEASTLLELALWKANLEDKKADRLEREAVRTTRGSRKRARKEISVTSGASIVIKNVLPFLQLE
eukprot:scaffold10467_cov182-Skeletonema_menzelii.AAC.1